jgi:restriction endonuclease S subunit
MNGELALLGKYCTIRSGQTFKGRLDEYSKGDITVLLPKDIIATGSIDKNATKVDAGAVPQIERHLLKKGEIIMVNKGVRFSTFLYDGVVPNVIATTAFYVITPSEYLMPEYLYWYLNQEEAKTYLTDNTQGSVIPTITKSVLMQLPVPLIPLATQNSILEFLKRSRTEVDLLKELIQKKEAFSDSYIWEVIQKYNN